MHTKNIVTSGLPLSEAGKAVIMLHGRGASAQDILGMKAYLQLADYALLAPQATNNTWYPYSFLSLPLQNEPWLSSALDIVDGLVADCTNAGINHDKIYFLGFSQGACLTLEYITRNAKKYGGAVAFTGGLIGDKIYEANYSGNFETTPIFIGTSNPDPHVPVGRVMETETVLKKMNADVTVKVYDNLGHSINQDEIDRANTLVFNVQPS